MKSSKNYKKWITALVLFAVVLTAQSCGDNEATKNLDGELFTESTASTLEYYQNGDVLSAAAPSPHGAFKLSYNATAAAALDSTGELPVGASFPTGSLIVKEVQTNGALSLLAIMKKDPNHEQAAEGWLWAEYDPDGSVVISVSKKGKQCTSCHGGSPNRDFVRTYDLH